MRSVGDTFAARYGPLVTLHDAIVEVLRSHGGGWMDRDAIAAEIARRDLFRRPSDGAHPPSDQIRLRARKPDYQPLFECSDPACTRIRLRPGSAHAEPAIRPPAAAVANEDGGADTAPATRRRGRRRARPGSRGTSGCASSIARRGCGCF